MENRLVCVCNMVSEKEVLTALKKGARTTSDIQKINGAATSCGKCIMTVDEIVAEYNSKRPDTPQQELHLG